MVNMNNMMKQMQAMQQKLAQTQEELARKEFEGASGGGLVRVIINGKSVMTKVTIDPGLMIKDEVDVLEDLILAAFNEAKKKCDEEAEGSMSGMLGGMQLPPGLKFPF